MALDLAMAPTSSTKFVSIPLCSPSPGLRLHQDPTWKDLVLFYEYFHGDTGKGLGASYVSYLIQTTVLT